MADFSGAAAQEIHPRLIAPRESGLCREEQWTRIEPVVRFVLAADEREFLLN